MYTKSALGLYRISIVNLPFSIKYVNRCGNYNISFDGEKDFDPFLLVVPAQARLVKVKDFSLAQAAILRGYGIAVNYYIPDLFRPAPLSAARSRVENRFECSSKEFGEARILKINNV
jgi:hypothetical protein